MTVLRDSVLHAFIQSLRYGQDATRGHFFFFFCGIQLVRFGLVWFSLALWHINHCWLFNNKSFYIYKIYDFYIDFAENIFFFVHRVK